MVNFSKYLTKTMIILNYIIIHFSSTGKSMILQTLEFNSTNSSLLPNIKILMEQIQIL